MCSEVSVNRRCQAFVRVGHRTPFVGAVGSRHVACKLLLSAHEGNQAGPDLVYASLLRFRIVRT